MISNGNQVRVIESSCGLKQACPAKTQPAMTRPMLHCAIRCAVPRWARRQLVITEGQLRAAETFTCASRLNQASKSAQPPTIGSNSKATCNGSKADAEVLLRGMPMGQRRRKRTPSTNNMLRPCLKHPTPSSFVDTAAIV